MAGSRGAEFIRIDLLWNFYVSRLSSHSHLNHILGYHCHPNAKVSLPYKRPSLKLAGLDPLLTLLILDISLTGLPVIPLSIPISSTPPVLIGA